MRGHRALESPTAAEQLASQLAHEATHGLALDLSRAGAKEATLTQNRDDIFEREAPSRHHVIMQAWHVRPQFRAGAQIRASRNMFPQRRASALEGHRGFDGVARKKYRHSVDLRMRSWSCGDCWLMKASTTPA